MWTGYVITSSPLYLGHNVSDDATNDRVWPIVSNTEVHKSPLHATVLALGCASSRRCATALQAIMISQQWSGHPGRLVKSWDPVGTQAWPLGRGVYNVTCDPDDRTQTGWSFDSEVQEVRGPEAGTCLDWKAADNRQVWAVNCTGVQAQRWTLGPADDEGWSALTTSQTHKALVIPGPQNSVGFGRKGDKQQTRFRLKDGQLQSNAGSCLAARAINPPTACAATSHVHAQACHTYELWAKPLRGSDWPSSAVAVLLVNNGLPANVSFSLPELGIRGGVSVRDVWAYRDAGTIEAGGERSIELGVHASALLVLR